MNQPLVSVVIPFYSGKKWLVEAVRSVAMQTYNNIELLVINDGSEEDISDLSINSLIETRIIIKQNGGPASARNLGLEVSKGKYIAFLDSDDLWKPDKLKTQVEYMERHGFVWCQHSYEQIYENSAKTKIIDTSVYSGYIYREIFISFKIQTSCVVVLRKAIIHNKFIFPENKRYGQDGDFYRQIARKFKLGYVDGVLSSFRVHGNNAGMRAAVQLNDKANTWIELQLDKYTMNLLPYAVICAYSISYKFNIIVKRINKIPNLSELKYEHFARLAYLIPYIIYRRYAK